MCACVYMHLYIYSNIARYVLVFFYPYMYMLSQATVARGGAEDDLRKCTQSLACAIADYKHKSKSARGLESQNKPKQPKGKSAAKSKPVQPS